MSPPSVLVVGHPNVVPHNQLVYVRLAELGWSVTLIVPNRWADDYTPRGFTPVPVGGFTGHFARVSVARPGNIVRHLWATRPTRWLRQARRPDVVFVEDEPLSTTALQWGQACRRLGIPWGVQGDENLDRPFPWRDGRPRPAVTYHADVSRAARQGAGEALLCGRQWSVPPPGRSPG